MSADATVSEPAAHDGQLPTRVRWARGGYVVIAGLFVIGIVSQVFIAGMAVFGAPANWSLHASFVLVVVWMPLVMLVLAFLGQLSRKLKLLSLVLIVLPLVQFPTALISSDALVGALHVVNALVLFGLAVVTVRRAWRAMSEPAGGGS